MFHYVFRIDAGSQYYFGVRSSKVPPQDDPHMGSGSFILYEIAYAKRKKVILGVYPSRFDAEAAKSVLIRTHHDDWRCQNRIRCTPRKRHV